MKRKKQRLPIIQSRTCGDCVACCYVFAIDGLDKPIGKDCRHLDRSGTEHHCAQYADRPIDCSSYECAWFRDLGGDEHRPDRLGVVFTPRLNRREVWSFAGSTTLVAHETRPGAFMEDAVSNFMDLVAQQFIIILFWGPRLTQGRVMGPETSINAVSVWLAKHGHTKITRIMQISEDSSFFEGL